MISILNLTDENSFPLQAGLPAGYRGIILQGAIAYSAQTASELVILQKFQRTDFAIQLGIYKFLHLIRCILQPPAFSTGSLLALKKNLKVSIEGFGTLTIKEGQFSFLQYNNENIQTDFRPGREYHILEISWSPEMIAQILPYFPGLTDQFQKEFTHSSSHLIGPQRSAGEKVLGLVHELLDSNYSAQVNEIFFEYKVREYLLLLMMESSKTEEPQILLTKAEEDQIQELAARMKLDPGGKFPISIVAREMGMNEMKLKLGFRQVFGKSIFNFHLDQRMNEAYRLLKDSDLSTKEIANLVGYEFTTNFITQFRKYYGFPPSNIQKKR